MLRPLYRLVHRRRHPLAAAFVIVTVWMLFAQEDAPSDLVINWGFDSGETSPDFLGVAIDAAMLTGGDWWSGDNHLPRPVDLTDPDLVRWSRVLSPAWVRLGGTEADRLWWQADGENVAEPNLNRADLDAFLGFVDRIKARAMITASTGPRVRRDGAWQPDQLHRLVNWLPDDFDGVLEFGNEPGVHWLMFGPRHQFGFEQYTREYQQARAMVGDIPLAGPANAFWPEVGEPLRALVGTSRTFLESGIEPDIFTWHYYPTQSDRCTVRTEGAEWESLLDRETVDEFTRQARRVRGWIDRYSPQTRLWLGETGPAQCGGEDRLTNRFGSSLWWLTHLGIAARTGQQTVIRQSLMGGDYALLAYRRNYSPNPDYWAQVLWQRLMGPEWLTPTGHSGPIQAYAHCHPTQTGTLTLLTVNLGDRPVTLSLPAGEPLRGLTVTSLALDSRLVQIEGHLPETLDWQQPNPLPWRHINPQTTQPPHSYRFTLFPDHAYCR